MGINEDQQRMNKINKETSQKLTMLVKAHQLLMNINEDTESFNLGICLKTNKGINGVPLSSSMIIRKLALRCDVVFDELDNITKNRFGINSAISGFECGDGSCGKCNTCIQEMKNRLAVYEARYGKIEESSDEIPQVLDDSFTVKG